MKIRSGWMDVLCGWIQYNGIRDETAKMTSEMRKEVTRRSRTIGAWHYWTFNKFSSVWVRI
jgi:hypothetical protein